MGALARLGIRNGKKVPLADLPAVGRAQQLSPFVRACFGRYGFARVAERILDRHPLSSKDIEALLVRAPLPVLMKLVELKGVPENVRSPQPLLVLPLSTWVAESGAEDAREKADKMIAQFAAVQPRIVLDLLSASESHFAVMSVAGSLMQKNAQHVFVGPTVDELISWVLAMPSRDPQGRLKTPQLEEVLSEIKRLGLHRLRPCSVVEVAPTVQAAGFPLSILTNLLEFESSGDLARELFRVHELSLEQSLEVWMPGFETRDPRPRAGAERAVREQQLLRLLAVGALTLSKVPFFRASSRYFSIDALRMASRFGANDFGFGAVNVLSARLLKIESYDTLRKVLTQPVSDQAALQLQPEV